MFFICAIYQTDLSDKIQKHNINILLHNYIIYFIKIVETTNVQNIL